MPEKKMSVAEFLGFAPGTLIAWRAGHKPEGRYRSFHVGALPALKIVKCFDANLVGETLLFLSAEMKLGTNKPADGAAFRIVVPRPLEPNLSFKIMQPGITLLAAQQAAVMLARNRDKVRDVLRARFGHIMLQDEPIH